VAQGWYFARALDAGLFEVKGRLVCVCGPGEFGDAAIDVLRNAGLEMSDSARLLAAGNLEICRPHALWVYSNVFSGRPPIPFWHPPHLSS
jgi:hypothetical protein